MDRYSIFLNVRENEDENERSLPDSKEAKTSPKKKNREMIDCPKNTKRPWFMGTPFSHFMVYPLQVLEGSNKQSLNVFHLVLRFNSLVSVVCGLFLLSTNRFHFYRSLQLQPDNVIRFSGTIAFFLYLFILNSLYLCF